MKKDPASIMPSIMLMSLLSAFGAGSCMFIIPIFAQDLGASYIELGIIALIHSISYVLVVGIGGYLSDKKDCTQIMVIGLILRIFSIGLLAIANTVFDIYLLSALGGIALGLFIPSSETLVLRINSKEDRIKSISSLNITFSIGMFIGPLTGGYIANIIGIRNLFQFSAVFTIISTIIAILLISRNFVNEEIQTEPIKEGVKAMISQFRNMFMFILPYGAIFGNIIYIFPAYANSQGETLSTVGILILVFGIGRVIGSVIVNWMSKRGERFAIISSSIILIFSHFILTIDWTLSLIILSVFLIGNGIGIIFPIALSIITKRNESKNMGLTIGSFETLMVIGIAIGPPLSGFAAENISLNSTFMVSTIMSVILLLTGSKIFKENKLEKKN